MLIPEMHKSTLKFEFLRNSDKTRGFAVAPILIFFSCTFHPCQEKLIGLLFYAYVCLQQVLIMLFRTDAEDIATKIIISFFRFLFLILNELFSGVCSFYLTFSIINCSSEIWVCEKQEEYFRILVTNHVHCYFAFDKFCIRSRNKRNY